LISKALCQNLRLALNDPLVLKCAESEVSEEGTPNSGKELIQKNRLGSGSFSFDRDCNLTRSARKMKNKDPFLLVSIKSLKNNMTINIPTIAARAIIKERIYGDSDKS
jgi:hypothetical protein